MTIPVQYLRECFDADFDAGELRWKNRPSRHFASCRAAAVWRTRFVGKIAGGPHKEGYVAVYMTVGGRRHGLLVHRILWAIRTGSWPAVTIDHRDTIRTNNSWANLREASFRDQNANRPAIRAGLKGATFDQRTGRFIAQITREGRNHFLGRFTTELAAHQAYAAAADRLHGEFARAV